MSIPLFALKRVSWMLPLLAACGLGLAGCAKKDDVIVKTGEGKRLMDTLRV